MASMHYLKQFDILQFYRFFVDGRYQKKYQGWIGYEEKERGSVQALLNGFEYMLDNFDLFEGLRSEYLRQLHGICLFNVESRHKKASAGDIRFQTTGMKFFANVGSDYDNIVEILDMRKGDGTMVFHAIKQDDYKAGKTADELDPKILYKVLKERKSLIYRPWYPNLDTITKDALDGKRSLSEFYEAKHYVQMSIVEKMDEIIDRFNHSILMAKSQKEKLYIIALLVRELEILHPFPDGNCRVFACVLLTHLLIYHGFPPAILKNPNLDGEVSLKLWIKEIEDGMNNTLALLEDPEMELFGHTVLAIPLEKSDEFAKMSAKLKEKIHKYREIYLTASMASLYTSGTWINLKPDMTFTGIGAKGAFQKGNLYFILTIDEWLQEKRNIQKEITKRINKGIRAIVISKKYIEGDLGIFIKKLDIPVLLVGDAFDALEILAHRIREEKNPVTVLITGTEGKTGSKILMHHVFSRQKNTHAVLSSANAAVPIRKSLVDLGKEDEIELLEFSVDAHMAKTIHGAKVVDPDYCFFTNIGKEHMHNHKSIEGVIEAKSSVVYGLRTDGTCFVNSSISVFDTFIDALRTKRSDINILTYGKRLGDSARLKYAIFNSKWLGWKIKADIEGIEVNYFLPLIQDYAPIASIGILLLAKTIGLDVKKAAMDFGDFKPFDSMGLVHNIPYMNGEILIYDQSRRASIFGVRSAFKDLEKMQSSGRTIALFGSISSVKTNEWTKQYHIELAELINQSNISRLYTTGTNMQYTYENLQDKSLLVEHSSDYNKLSSMIYEILKPGDILVVMGYMRLRLDKIVIDIIDKLKQKKIISPKLVDNLSLDTSKQYRKFIETENKKQQQEISGRLLVHFFDNLDQVLDNRYGLMSANLILKLNGYEDRVYSKSLCSKWFEKISSQPQARFFGSFYFIGDTKYMLHVALGTYNLHIGFVAYECDNEDYKLTSINEKEIKEITERYGSLLSADEEFKKRKWGYELLTVSCGNMINIKKEDKFQTLYDFENSRTYRKIFKPLLYILSLKEK